MKRYLPYLALVLGVAWLAGTLVPWQPKSKFNLVGFDHLPVLASGRVKPLDTVARTSLLEIQGKQTVTTPDGKRLTPIEWLLDTAFDAPRADNYRVFRIDNSDLLGLLGISEAETEIHYHGGRQLLAAFGLLPSKHTRFSYNQISSHFEELDHQTKLVEPIPSEKRNAFQRAVIQLRNSVGVYQQLQNTFVAPDSDDFLGELLRFQQALPTGVAAVRAKEEGKTYDQDAYDAMMQLGQRYGKMASSSSILVIPPQDPAQHPGGWQSTGHALLTTFGSGYVNPNVLAYAGLAHAWRHQQPEQFNQLVSLYQQQLAKHFGPQLRKTGVEVRFNEAQPFYSSTILYVLVFLLAIFSWLKWPQTLGRCAFWLMALAFIVTSAGIFTRMWLEGRPPVTNLYSSALFIGWGAVLLCLILEGLYKNGVGSVAGGLIGFGTLVIAHHLSLSGDTLEMMQAVLDSNFWLSTHVVVVTSGYASTYLAGFLAIIYVFRGLLTKTLDKKTADNLTRMVYGIVCFALLFSFAGTVLGGIWADQSWGRFWGWDPKENGALVIVLWNAIILHARWGGLVKQRGLMCLAIFGNVVTSWSWFGTNMLGIGLHSYGFMAAAFWWLLAFVFTQLAIIALANIPLSKWRSFRRPAV